MIYLILTLVMLSTQTETTEISFGSGGGFSGISKDFTLDREGNLFKVNVFTDEKTLLKKIDKEKTAQIFEKVDDDHLRKYKVYKPGNTYKYITIKDGNKTLKKVWSGISENNKLNLIYKDLNTLRKSKE